MASLAVIVLCLLLLLKMLPVRFVHGLRFGMTAVTVGLPAFDAEVSPAIPADFRLAGELLITAVAG
jgi:hypothetical protein